MINRLAVCTAAVLVLLLQSPTANASQDNMVKRLIHASSILRNFAECGGGIPHRIMENAKGVAILDVDKGGIFVSGSGGTGVLVVRTPCGDWSAPSAISTGSIGMGLQLGVQRERLVLILNNDLAVEAFTDPRNDKFSIGSDITIAAGPEHENTQYLTISPADVYIYRMTSGAYCGAAITGNAISTDVEVNYRFYGKKMSPQEIISEENPQPEEAKDFYEALAQTEKPPEVADNVDMQAPPEEAPPEPPHFTKRYYYGTPSWEAPPTDQDANLPPDMYQQYQGEVPPQYQPQDPGEAHAPSTYESRPYQSTPVVH